MGMERLIFVKENVLLNEIEVREYKNLPLDEDGEVEHVDDLDEHNDPINTCTILLP